MPMGIAFWVLMILWLVFGLWWNTPNYRGWLAGNWVLFILLALLGWHDFGPPLR